VTIVIPTWDNPEMIRQVTENIFRLSTLPFEIIIVDNASRTNDSLEFLDAATRRAGIRVLRMAENRYYWPAINEGIRAAARSTEYILALNDDIIVLGDQWLQRLIRRIEDDPSVGFAGDFHSQPAFQPLGGWIDGYCALFRRRIFDEVGLFDEDRPFHWGFVDFQLRAFKRGYRGVDIKGAGDVTDHIDGIVHHLRGRTLKAVRDSYNEKERSRLLGSKWTPARLLLQHGFYWAALRYCLALR
jgi:GT2 family glycosyltransferase